MDVISWFVCPSYCWLVHIHNADRSPVEELCFSMLLDSGEDSGMKQGSSILAIQCGTFKMLWISEKTVNADRPWAILLKYKLGNCETICWSIKIVSTDTRLKVHDWFKLFSPRWLYAMFCVSPHRQAESPSVRKEAWQSVQWAPLFRNEFENNQYHHW